MEDKMKTMESKDGLEAIQKSMVAISALTAKGDVNALKIAIGEGLDDGLTINEIKEAVVQLYAYCGFPRSINGLNALMSVIEERKASGKQDEEGKEASPIPDGDKYATGKATLQKLTGKEEKALSGANAFAPVLDTFLKEHLFADIFNRDVLNHTQREMITIAALMTQDGVAPQLQAHLAMGMNVGITGEQIEEMISIIEKTVGTKEADVAKDTFMKVMEARAEKK